MPRALLVIAVVSATFVLSSAFPTSEVDFMRIRRSPAPPVLGHGGFGGYGGFYRPAGFGFGGLGGGYRGGYGANRYGAYPGAGVYPGGGGFYPGGVGGVSDGSFSSASSQASSQSYGNGFGGNNGASSQASSNSNSNSYGGGIGR